MLDHHWLGKVMVINLVTKMAWGSNVVIQMFKLGFNDVVVAITIGTIGYGAGVTLKMVQRR
jgi:hypothetical protein